MAFIYQGFLLAILTMRVMVVRLHELKAQVDVALQKMTLQKMTIATTCHTTKTQTFFPTAIASMDPGLPRITTRHAISVPSLWFTHGDWNHHVCCRSEQYESILNVWEAIGSNLTRLQTVLLLLMYTASAASHCHLSNRIYCNLVYWKDWTMYCTLVAPDYWFPWQSCWALCPCTNLYASSIRLRAGNFHITVEYANTLTAWFFGLFLVMFGMKLPKI